MSHVILHIPLCKFMNPLHVQFCASFNQKHDKRKPSFDPDWVTNDKLADLGALTQSSAPDAPPTLTAAKPCCHLQTLPVRVRSPLFSAVQHVVVCHETACPTLSSLVVRWLTFWTVPLIFTPVLNISWPTEPFSGKHWWTPIWSPGTVTSAELMFQPTNNQPCHTWSHPSGSRDREESGGSRRMS